ncbi:Transglycosylase-like [uncultured Caudovirales phage]|uniref:Transglycosylase-like n=1 Tax=uncultured Caudovirales phage TaxID=2100421 RepID=A0A6J7WTY5_9CAUD|nr:Transglycosylase-like [uncultured Caudovirales phage]
MLLRIAVPIFVFVTLLSYDVAVADSAASPAPVVTAIVTTTTTVPPEPIVVEQVVETTTTTTIAPPAPSSPKDVGAFLSCVRARESGGDYTAVNPSSDAAGAYQMLLSTSNVVAGWMNRPDLIGISASKWLPAEQDEGAMVLYAHMGESPWYYPPKPC